MTTKKILAALAAASMLTLVPAFTMSASAEELGTAELIGQAGTYQYWGNSSAGVESTAAFIDGDGDYTTTWEISGDGTGSIEFLALQLDSFDENYMTAETYPNINITINSVTVDGQTVDYTTSPEAVNYSYYESDKGSTRVYLCDSWGPGGFVQDVAKDQPITQSISVNFTVSGLNAAEETTAPEEDPATTTTAESSETEETTTTPIIVTDENGNAVTDENGNVVTMLATTTTTTTTTAAAAGNNNDYNNGYNAGYNNGYNSGYNNGASYNGGGSYSSNGGSSYNPNSYAGSYGNGATIADNATVDEVSQTADFNVAMVAVGATGAMALAGAAFTIVKRKKK